MIDMAIGVDSPGTDNKSIGIFVSCLKVVDEKNPFMFLYLSPHFRFKQKN